MKKTIAVLIAFMMLFGLCSCSSEPENEEFVPKRGTVENGVYKNSAFGISYTADENWYYYSDEEISATMGIASEEILTDEYAEALANAEIIYDMYCADLETGATVNVNYENLGIVYGTILDESGYLNAAVAQMEGSGIVFSKLEIETVSIDGAEVPCLSVIIDYYGISIYEIVAVKKCGDWMGVVTVATLDEALLPELVSGISFG